MNYVLIIGAKSDIAKELARVYSQNGYNLYLAARESESLKSLSFDIKLRSGVDVQTKELDITEFESHKEFYSPKKSPAKIPHKKIYQVKNSKLLKIIK